MILALCAGRTAPAELRARLAYDELAQRSVLEAERPGVGELALLCTCHRTEAYFTSAGDDAATILWKQGARLSIVSRSGASAARLAENFDAPSYQLSELGAVLDKSDFAVVAVSGGIAVRPRHLPVRTREHPFVIVDLS